MTIDPAAPMPAKLPPHVGPQCICADDKDLARLQAFMAGGMGQWEASRLVWPVPVPPPPPAMLPPAITPRPSRHARLLNRWINREVS